MDEYGESSLRRHDVRARDLDDGTSPTRERNACPLGTFGLPERRLSGGLRAFTRCALTRTTAK